MDKDEVRHVTKPYSPQNSERERKIERQIDRERQRETERDRERQTERDRERERQTDRQTERERDRQTEREREREECWLSCATDQFHGCANSTPKMTRGPEIS